MRRIVLVVDDDLYLASRGQPFKPMWSVLNGLTIESEEPLPEPNRVQEFRVRVETPVGENPWTATQVKTRILNAHHGVTVTEVDPT